MTKVLLAVVVLSAGWGVAQAQTVDDSPPNWQEAAGKAAFEVDSVREDKGEFKHHHLPLVSTIPLKTPRDVSTQTSDSSPT